MKNKFLVLGASVLLLVSCVSKPQLTYNLSLNYNQSRGVVSGAGSYHEHDNVEIGATPFDGYNFDGWFVGDDVVSKNNPYIFDMPGMDLSFTAQFSLEEFNITYILNGGTNSEDNPDTYTVETNTIVLEDAYKVGCVFDGWTDENGDKVVSIPKGSTGDITLSANWVNNTHEVAVTANDPELGVINGAGTYQAGSTVIIACYPIEGYCVSSIHNVTTDETVYESVYSFIMPDFDVDIVVNFEIVTYSIYYNLYGGTNDSRNAKTYTVESDDIVLYPATKENYQFAGWKHNGEVITCIPSGSTGNIILDAQWTQTKHEVTIINEDTDAGVALGEGSYAENEVYTLSAYPNDGYKVEGWYVDGELFSKNEVLKITMGTEDVTYEIKWEEIVYNISYELNGGTVEVPNPTTYTVNSEFTLNDASKNGYEFLGWTDENGDKVTGVEKGTTGDLEFTANFYRAKATVTLYVNDEDMGTVEGAGSFDGESTVTVTATAKSGYAFKGWYSDNLYTELESIEEKYSFVILENTVLYAKFITIEEHAWDIEHGVVPSIVGDTIKFGMYPQTHVNDGALITELDKLEAPEDNGYYLYEGEYYCLVKEASPWFHANSQRKFDDGTEIANGGKYWFKVEAISWNIWKTYKTTSNYMVASSKLLRPCLYNTDSYSGKLERTDYQGDVGTVYANNYKYSSMRTYLNTTFYNNAWWFGESSIQITNVNNSPNSTGDDLNLYACENTSDKVYAIGKAEYSMYYKLPLENSRKIPTTDFARALGAFNYRNDFGEYNSGIFYLRSPYNNGAIYAQGVSTDGSYSRLGIAENPQACLRAVINVHITVKD